MSEERQRSMKQQAPETALQMAERHVREGRERVARQRQIVREMERDAHPKAAEIARRTLAIFEDNLRLSIEHLDLERTYAGKG